MSRAVQGMALTDAELNVIKQGITDGYHAKASTRDAENSFPEVQALLRDRVQKAGQAYLAKAAGVQGAVKTPSGIVYIKIREGTGANPTKSDRVKVAYEGRLTDGSVFDSSANHGGSASFALAGVIPCWTEAVQLMRVGGKSRIVCPSDLAYRERGSQPRIKPNSTLEFDIELLGIEAAPSVALPGSGAAAAPTPPSPPQPSPPTPSQATK
jgi:FKBP-type peptidyl-prolyl cis-trans isomerase